MRRLLYIVVLSLFLFDSASADTGTTRAIYLLGELDEGHYQVMLASLLSKLSKKQYNLLVLPIGLSPSETELSAAERKELLSELDHHTLLITAACRDLIPPGTTCRVASMPVFTTKDAGAPSGNTTISPNTDAIFLLGENNLLAATILRATYLGEEITRAYRNGVFLFGHYAPLPGIQELSSNTLDNLQNPFQFSGIVFKVEPLLAPEIIGMEKILIDHHLGKPGRLAGLINIVSLPGSIPIILGISDNSGVFLVNEETLIYGYGEQPILLLDADTYHADDTTKYSGEGLWMSTRNILFHQITSSEISYDILSQETSISSVPQKIQRAFNAFSLPGGSGSLLVTGEIVSSENSHILLNRFANLSGGKNAQILIVVVGYETEASAIMLAQLYQKALATDLQTTIQILEAGEPLDIPAGVSGIILLSADNEGINPEDLSTITNAWQSGIPVMACGKAAALIGQSFPLSQDSIQLPVEPPSFAPALGLVNALFHTELLTSHDWQQITTLGTGFQDSLSIILPFDAAVEFSQSGAFSIGKNSVIVLDFRNAVILPPTTGSPAFANGLMDIFSPGEPLMPALADKSFSPIRLATPKFSVFQQTLVAAGTSEPPKTTAQGTQPTKSLPGPSEGLATPSPKSDLPILTSTPLAVVAPLDDKDTNQMIIIAASILMIVILGVLFNRKRLQG